MSAPQSLLQAALNRLSARLASGLADTAATVGLLAQDAPERLRQEIQLFWQEVEQEAERLERQGQAPGSAAAPARGAGGPSAAGPSGAAAADPQEMIDALRAQVAGLAQRLDSPPGSPSGGGA